MKLKLWKLIKNRFEQNQKEFKFRINDNFSNLDSLSAFSCPETQYQVFNKNLNRMECECKKGYIKVNGKCEGESQAVLN
jgi:hypothetical protein